MQMPLITDFENLSKTAERLPLKHYYSIIYSIYSAFESFTRRFFGTNQNTIFRDPTEII